ncbi:hypothetical protein SDC9_129045 [bioreactor metagenome]|uniref:Uncharacterized protein n=1 Tax=bioreactor metagenome TaxID=1076179 RepID=A0A645CYJ4_9ZZZZ
MESGKRSVAVVSQAVETASGEVAEDPGESSGPAGSGGGPEQAPGAGGGGSC